MATSQHTLRATAPLPKGRVGRKDPEPAVVLSRHPTGALIQVDMSSMDVELAISDTLFMVESQHRVRHDLYVSQGTFLVPVHNNDPATLAAWKRWVPYSEFFYHTIEVLCGRQRVAVTAERTDPVQAARASEFPPSFIETPHTIGPVAVV